MTLIITLSGGEAEHNVTLAGRTGITWNFRAVQSNPFQSRILLQECMSTAEFDFPPLLYSLMLMSLLMFQCPSCCQESQMAQAFSFGLEKIPELEVTMFPVGGVSKEWRCRKHTASARKPTHLMPWTKCTHRIEWVVTSGEVYSFFLDFSIKQHGTTMQKASWAHKKVITSMCYYQMWASLLLFVFSVTPVKAAVDDLSQFNG